MPVYVPWAFFGWRRDVLVNKDIVSKPYEGGIQT